MDENRQKDIVQLNLGGNIKKLVIDGILFSMDMDDVEVYKALENFKEHYTLNDVSEEECSIDDILDKCKETIDIILGEGTSDRLFNKKTMKMYLLVNELANVFLENFMKEEREKKEAEFKKELDNLTQLFDGMNKIAQTMAYADKTYGNRGMNSYVHCKGSSRRNKRKRH